MDSSSDYEKDSSIDLENQSNDGFSYTKPITKIHFKRETRLDTSSSSGSDSDEESDGSQRNHGSGDHEQDVSDEPDDQDEQEELRPSFGGLGLGSKLKPLFSNDVKPKMEYGIMNQKMYNPLGTQSKAFTKKEVTVDKDFAAFEKNTKGIGLKLLKKMGYVPGQGLGKDGTGIVNPIDAKMRPSGVGLGMIDERSKSVMDEKKAERPNERKSEKQKEDRWKKQGIKKRKPMYKMASEVIHEEMASTIAPAIAAPISSKIRDLRGENEVVFDDLQAFSSAQSGASIDQLMAKERLPELRHNLKLIADISKKDLLYISRQIKIEQASRETRFEEIKTFNSLLLNDKQSLERSLVVESIVKDIHRISTIHIKDLTDPQVDPAIISQLFGPLFIQLTQEYEHEFKLYHLDHLICGIIACVVKSRIRTWNPLEDPLLFGYLFSEWSQIMKRIFGNQDSKGETEKLPAHRRNEISDQPTMSSFESVLYSVWLPRIRQVVNNEWNPEDPDKLIELVEFYKKHDILPKWFFSNIIIQLVLPKLERYLEDHKISKVNDGHKLHVWLFPWLPLLGTDTMRPIWKTVRRKIQLFLQNWDPIDPVAMEILDIWSQVWDDSDTQALITNSILPKLVIYLRHSFAINPSNQDLVPLLHVFEWKTYIPAHLFSHLLETEFFKGWTTCLWTWITSAQANLDEISQWYTHWKKLFADHGLEKIESCKHGFKTGLDMMNQGVSASLDKKGRAAFIPSIQIAPSKSAVLQAPVLDTQSITFKDMVTEVFAESSLEFIPIGKRHRETGKDLYKLGKRTYVYIDDGVLYCSSTGSGGEYKFMSIDDAIELAQN